MNKPLGYYTPHTPGDGTLLDELEQQHGSNFENLTQPEKFFIIYDLGLNLYGHSLELHPQSTEVVSKLAQILGHLRSLEPSTKVAIIKFLIDNCGNLPSSVQYQPDPAWDYYETWQLFRNMKQIAESGMKLIGDKENADGETGQELQELIEPLLIELSPIVDDLSADTILHLE